MSATLRIGTRRSMLAMAQAGKIADALAALDCEASLVGVTTRGDTTSAALTQIGGTGVFVSALRERLLAGDIDMAVHSLKDLPTGGASGLVIAAIPGREDPYDAVVARDGLTLAELPSGARVGTGSLRRAAQLRALYPGLEVVEIRGNVDTRIGKIASGECDAVVLARAGLTRLGRDGEVTETLDAARMTPAPGQGALAVECREDHAELTALLGGLDEPASRAAVTAERSVLATLEAGCSAPVGAYAQVDPAGDCAGDRGERGTGGDKPGGSEAGGEDSGDLHLRALVASVDGAFTIRLSARGPSGDAEDIGRRLAEDMLNEGAGALVGAGEWGGE